jgi:HAD superfamily hydrolase (TIGR01509 family)
MKTILVDAAGTFVVEKKINQDMYALLEQYPNEKIILTNANDAQLKEFGIINMPYPVFTLKHNPDKTDPEYFTIFLQQNNLKPEDCIYFEHSEEAVQSANTQDITTYHYDNTKSDLIALKQFIDNNL